MCGAGGAPGAIINNFPLLPPSLSSFSPSKPHLLVMGTMYLNKLRRKVTYKLKTEVYISIAINYSVFFFPLRFVVFSFGWDHKLLGAELLS